MSRLCVLLTCVVVAATGGCGGAAGSAAPAAKSPSHSASPSASPTLDLDRGEVRFSKSDTRRLRRIFLADRAFLTDKGLKDASQIELRLLSGSDTFYCPPVEITYTATGPGPDYCQPSAGAPIGTIILNARFLSGEVPDLLATSSGQVTGRRFDSTALGAAAAVFGHEMGHAQQALRNGNSPPTAGVATELQADCYAGRMVARATPRLLAPATQFMRHVPGDSRHGSARERLAAFERGAHGGKCTA